MSTPFDDTRDESPDALDPDALEEEDVDPQDADADLGDPQELRGGDPASGGS
jgi:hypothetical protein